MLIQSATVAALAACAVLAAAPAPAAPFLPDFGAASFAPGAAVDNPYFPLAPGGRKVLRASGVDEGGEPVRERSDLQVLGPGPEILGVTVTTQRDRAYEDGVLVEDTFDYFAQDVVGNVWYLGEDVTNYRYDDAGNLIGTDDASAWRAGVNGALPGYIMPADPQVDFTYYQEFAEADEALDQATIFDRGGSITIGDTTYRDVLQVLETNPLEPDALEFKYFAPGVGAIRADEGLDANLSNPELVFELAPAPVPLPAGFPLALIGTAAIAAFARRRR